MTTRIALVVPSLSDPGGLGSVAEFLRRTIRTRPDFDLRLVSIPMSSRDQCSTRLLCPASVFSGITTTNYLFNGEPVLHVGGSFVEIETQRMMPRAPLTRAIADCDLIQVVAGAPSWALAVMGLDKPVVLQVATLTSVERKKKEMVDRRPLRMWHAAMTRVVSRLDERALRNVNAILVENTWMFEHAKALARHDAIVRYAPPGIDLGHFVPLPKRNPEAGYILSVGRLNDPRKNIGLLAEAYSLVCRRYLETPMLVLAGAAGPDREFWARAEALGISNRILFRENPNRSELAALYRGAQSFVLTSDEEGFGVVVIEAMASGVPVVSTRCGGPDSIVTNDYDGYLVDCDNFFQLADRLELLARDASLNRSMGDNARRTAETRFGEQVAGSAFLETYDTLLGK